MEQNKGTDGPRFIAEEVAHLALNGDEAGIARWKRIASALDDLRDGRRQ